MFNGRKKRKAQGRGISNWKIWAVLDKVSEWLEQTQPAGDNGHGSGFTAGKYEGVALGELWWCAHFIECELEVTGGRDMGRSLAEEVYVLDNAALEGEHPNGNGFVDHRGLGGKRNWGGVGVCVRDVEWNGVEDQSEGRRYRASLIVCRDR